MELALCYICWMMKWRNRAPPIMDFTLATPTTLPTRATHGRVRSRRV